MQERGEDSPQASRSFRCVGNIGGWRRRSNWCQSLSCQQALAGPSIRDGVLHTFRQSGNHIPEGGCQRPHRGRAAYHLITGEWRLINFNQTKSRRPCMRQREATRPRAAASAIQFSKNRRRLSGPPVLNSQKRDPSELTPTVMKREGKRQGEPLLDA